MIIIKNIICNVIIYYDLYKKIFGIPNKIKQVVVFILKENKCFRRPRIQFGEHILGPVAYNCPEDHRNSTLSCAF